MKKLTALAIVATLCFTGCAQKEEKREDFKETHNKDYKRNAGVDSAAFDNQSQRQDSVSK